MKVLKEPDTTPWTQVLDCRCGARLETEEADLFLHCSPASSSWNVRCPCCKRDLEAQPTEPAKIRWRTRHGFR